MNQYSNSASVQLLNVFRKGGSWARGCVQSLIDDIAAATARHERGNGLVFVSARKIDVFAIARSGSSQLAVTFPGRPSEVIGLVPQKLDRRMRKGTGIRFSDEQAVLKRVILPSDARDVVSAIIRNKVEGLAPWPISQAVWGYRVSAVPGDASHMAVDVGILSRRSVDEIAEVLGKSGVTLTGVEIGQVDDDGDTVIPIDIHGDRRSKRARRTAGTVFAAVAAVALAIAGYGLFLALGAANELAQIEQRSAEVTAALRNNGQDVSTSAKLVEANRLYARKLERPPMVSVINALSQLLPTPVWLDSVLYTADKITVSGQGRNIPPLVEILERSAMFRDVNFASATKRNAELNIDEFSLSAAIEPQQVAQ